MPLTDKEIKEREEQSRIAKQATQKNRVLVAQGKDNSILGYASIKEPYGRDEIKAAEDKLLKKYRNDPNLGAIIDKFVLDEQNKKYPSNSGAKRYPNFRYSTVGGSSRFFSVKNKRGIYSILDSNELFSTTNVYKFAQWFMTIFTVNGIKNVINLKAGLYEGILRKAHINIKPSKLFFCKPYPYDDHEIKMDKIKPGYWTLRYESAIVSCIMNALAEGKIDAQLYNIDESNIVDKGIDEFYIGIELGTYSFVINQRATSKRSYGHPLFISKTELVTKDYEIINDLLNK